MLEREEIVKDEGEGNEGDCRVLMPAVAEVK